jgi:hypothetical protein
MGSGILIAYQKYNGIKFPGNAFIKYILEL